jgi:hypothetical protein
VGLKCVAGIDEAHLEVLESEGKLETKKWDSKIILPKRRIRATGLKLSQTTKMSLIV